MHNLSEPRVAAKLIALALFLVTIFVFTDSVTDPVNAPKLFLLGGFSFALVGVLFTTGLKKLFSAFRNHLLVLAFFVFASVVAFVTSTSPFTQQLYGVYGRNNGILLYFCLAILFIGALIINTTIYFRWLLYALFAAGIANVVYGVWTVAFGDFIGWANPYGNLLGTLGNPNFAGSFLGMFSALLFAVIFSPSFTRSYKFFVAGLLPITFFCIMQTEAVQGKVLFVVGCGISIFFYLRHKTHSWTTPALYTLLSGVVSSFALMGALQIGPLTKFIYKTSVSLRGEYWSAGITTGLSNQFSGVGFDAYGDWYRRSRRESALTLPGVDTVTNTAHNVYLDIFSFGGWPLFISYIALNTLVVISIVKVILKKKDYDLTFVGLASVWICYQLQSIISINQVGLAIWGWALGGAIVAYENFLNINNPTNLSSARAQKTTQQEVVTPSLRAGIAAIIGLIIAAPPLASDIKWRLAQESRDADRLSQMMEPSYMNPLNSFTINNIVGVFETSNLSDLAHKYALEAIKYNPDNFDSWKNLYSISASTEEEKVLALRNMKRLDPLNPSLKKLS
jgi:hypothetical protein